MTDQNMKELEYNGRPIRDLIIEMSLMMKQILERVVHIEESLVDLQNKKADKTVFTSYETRLANLENKYDLILPKIKEFGLIKKLVFGAASLMLISIIMTMLYKIGLQ